MPLGMWCYVDFASLLHFHHTCTCSSPLTSPVRRESDPQLLGYYPGLSYENAVVSGIAQHYCAVRFCTTARPSVQLELSRIGKNIAFCRENFRGFQLCGRQQCRKIRESFHLRKFLTIRGYYNSSDVCIL